MKAFGDRLVAAVREKRNPCVIGLDPRVDQMPRFITDAAIGRHGRTPEAVRECIVSYHRMVLTAVADLVPAVKPQIAFYEQYGMAGLAAFVETVELAKAMGLLVIVDAKRNDISSTAQAYANAFLGATAFFDQTQPVFDVDCVTVSPYLGLDSIVPFVNTCREFGKGIFILVKTSNPGSSDLQNLEVAPLHAHLYEAVAKLVRVCAEPMIGESGYSSVGAVVGATFPKEADLLREAMPHSIFLVPGYGAQGGTADDAAHCFDTDGFGAVINASRSITYGFSADIEPDELRAEIRSRTGAMVDDIAMAIQRRRMGA